MNRAVVITGCSSGFGRDVALRVAGLGDRVYATMRDPGGKNAEAARALQAAGIDLGVRDRNAAVESHDTGLLDAAGLTAFATLRTAGTQ